MKKLVLLGGGHSHAEVLRQFALERPVDTDITVVTRDVLAPYSGMLPGFVAGHYSYSDIHIDVRALAKACGARVVHSECIGLDLNNQQLQFPGRPPVLFDFLSVNTGSRPAWDDAPGALEFAIPAKPVDQFLQRFESLLEDAQAQAKYPVVIVGGGAGGVELALTMHHRMQSTGIDSPMIQLITNSDSLLPTHNLGVRKRVLQKFRQRGIKFMTGLEVVSVKENEIYLADDSTVPYEALIWTTHASPPEWIKNSGIETDNDGFILVNDYLQSTSNPTVFAGGDIATMQSTPRPKSGVFAVRQGPYLAQNIRAAVENKPLEKFKPQKQFLSLLGTGDTNAIASKGSFAAQGGWVWAWKNHIDQKFMRMYEMEMAAHTSMESDAPMYCGGCGSKVGQSLLERALAKIDVREHSSIVVGLKHPDDAAVVDYGPNAGIVHTVDHFRSFIDDPFLFGKITASHCLSDCYAMGAAPHNALATVTLAHGSDVQQGAILYELLAGANEVLEADNVALVGGHTAEGTELSFGFTINGTIDPDFRPTKTGARAGDVLILTKPIGTGVLFAADMQKKARTYWLDAAIEQMVKTNKYANQALEADVHAMTDITGFGLAGHLAEMLHGSNLQAHLELDKVPILEGALECSLNGIFSTLYPQNLISESKISNRSEASKHPAYPLLFDPQTSGGLLAAVAEKDAHIATTRNVGTVIGTIHETSDEGGTIRVI